MNWLLTVEIAYLCFLIFVCLRIIYDTRSITKALAYLLFAIFVPVFGIMFYFAFGVNYRSRKMYSKKLIQNDELRKKVLEDLYQYSQNTFRNNINASIRSNKELAYMLLHEMSPLTANNSVKLLVNGEEKFPEVLRCMEEAKHHIHIEYYIYENGDIGRSIEEVLIRKAKQGVEVRFIYDDFGSRGIRKNIVKKLKLNGVKAFPFMKVYLLLFANRLNYRNHRKIIVIDGRTAFVGGINVSDRYINQPHYGKKFNVPDPQKRIFWRDTHLRIDGPGVMYLQYLFLCDWNFAADKKIDLNRYFFPEIHDFPVTGNKLVQIAASGPDSKTPTILFSIIQAINLTTEEILITSPYFIPGQSLLDALIIASLSGISVKLLVPGVSDSRFVNIAARSFYDDLLRAGVEIYLYRKGFMHAKTIVADRKIAIVGTANMDVRSFELNFEVNAVVYDQETAMQLRRIFYEDLKDADKIDAELWFSRPTYKKLVEKTARLLSPLL